MVPEGLTPPFDWLAVLAVSDHCWHTKLCFFLRALSSRTPPLSSWKECSPARIILSSLPGVCPSLCGRHSNHRWCSEPLPLVTVMCHQPVGSEFVPGHGLLACKVYFMKLAQNDDQIQTIAVVLRAHFSVASLFISPARLFGLEFYIHPLIFFFLCTDLKIKDTKISDAKATNWNNNLKKKKDLSPSPRSLELQSTSSL